MTPSGTGDQEEFITVENTHKNLEKNLFLKPDNLN